LGRGCRFWRCARPGLAGYRWLLGREGDHDGEPFGRPDIGRFAMSGEPGDQVDFAAINAAALRALPALLRRWLPDGKQLGAEWIARNPRRADRHAGSFKVNLRTGRWGDFASGEVGGDPISLAAYLSGLG